MSPMAVLFIILGVLIIIVAVKGTYPDVLTSLKKL